MIKPIPYHAQLMIDRIMSPAAQARALLYTDRNPTRCEASVHAFKTHAMLHKARLGRKAERAAIETGYDQAVRGAKTNEAKR